MLLHDPLSVSPTDVRNDVSNVVSIVVPIVVVLVVLTILTVLTVVILVLYYRGKKVNHEPHMWLADLCG